MLTLDPPLPDDIEDVGMVIDHRHDTVESSIINPSNKEVPVWIFWLTTHRLLLRQRRPNVGLPGQRDRESRLTLMTPQVSSQ
jgi:hypothetical protein